jgi:tetratricopeptide (TPR) repeat protein
VNRPLLALLLVAGGCGSEAPPPTEEEALARERAARDAKLTGVRAKAYGSVRNAIPEGELQVKSATVNTSEMAGLFAASYLLAGQRHLALFEVSRAKEEEIPEEARAGLYLTRGFVYSSLGWPRLAKAEFEHASPSPEDRSDRAAEIRKAMHYGSVFLHLKSKDHRAAAKEVTAVQDVFAGDAVGELLLALAHADQGDFGKAAESLDRSAAATPALAERLRGLAKELREAKDPLGLAHREVSKRLGASLAFGGAALRAKYDAALDKVREKAKALAPKEEAPWGEDYRRSIGPLRGIIGSDAKVEVFRLGQPDIASSDWRDYPKWPVTEGPIVPDAETRLRLASILLEPESFGSPPKPCEPSPGVKVRYVGPKETAELYFCFECLMVFTYKDRAPLGDENFDPAKDPLVEIVKRLFPKDSVIQKLK